MPSYNSTHTGTQIDNAVDTYQTQSQVQALINSAIETAVAQTKLAMYPIGSIYISLQNTNPSTFIGGTWQQIKDTFILAAGDTYTAGNTGGQASYTAADMPAHTHTRGTMNITGRIGHNNSYSGTFTSGGHEGAFYNVPFSGTNYYLSSRSVGSGWYDVAFEASRSWTGETSQSGTNTNATIMPPYLVAYVWKRIA